MPTHLPRLLYLVAVFGVACGNQPGARDSASSGEAPSAESVGSTPVERGLVARYGRGACYGACPEYDVTIKDDGTVVYHGKTFVITTGDAEKRIAREEVGRVRAAFDATSFFTVEAPVPSFGSSDGPSGDFLYYVRDGKARRIDLPTGCDGAPVGKALTDLRVELDRIVAIENWIGTSEERKRFGDGYAH